MAVLQADSYHERIQKRTFRILLVLTTFDIFFLVTSAIIFCTSFIHKDLPFNRKLLLNISAVVGSYGSISSICNCLATFDNKKGRLCFLLPYLAFLPMVILLLFIILVTVVFSQGFIETLLLSAVMFLVLAYIWLKLLKQWSTMSKSLLTVSQQQNIEGQLAAAQVIFEQSQGEVGQANGGFSRDPPPKYGSLETVGTQCPPPCYEEAVKYEEEFKESAGEI